MTSRVEWLIVRGDADVWRSLGLVVDDEGFIPFLGTALRIVEDRESEQPPALVGWALSGLPESPDSAPIDGLTTERVAPRPPQIAMHPIGASGLDHVVVMTPDLVRTSGCIADATGHELKRVREVGTMKQGFHRMDRGGLIVEVVERPEIPEGIARFWGLVINVDDIDAACALLGDDAISRPKDAVQPGRRIATVRDGVGLGLPVALMTI